MNISDLTKSISAAVDALPSGDDIKYEERRELLTATERLKTALETPVEAAFRIIFGTHLIVALRLGIDMGLIDAMVNADGGEVEISQLSASTGADSLLIIRIMRILAGMNLCKEVKQGTYVATRLTRSFVSASSFSAIVVYILTQDKVLVQLPDYFQENGYQSPSDAYSGPFQYALGTKLHHFDWLKETPKQQVAFNKMMQITHRDRGEDWFDNFPVEEKLHNSSGDSNFPLLLDIGGGLGSRLTAFKAKYPNLPGRLILQDLSVVIDDIKSIGPGIELMKHDFFAPQPIKGARAYYLRCVLHDWPDKSAREILQNVRAAMTKDSILLLEENVLPDVNVPFYAAQVDLSMMVLLSGLERTQKQWLDLLDSAGFTLVKAWTSKNPVVRSLTLLEAAPK